MALASLKDYGIIGCAGRAALIDRFGSIDWCCFPSIDSPSHFDSDQDLVGRFQLRPQGEFHSEQRYLQRTQVLETLFETPFGRAVLTDWMPFEAHAETAPTIYRRLEVTQGRVQFMLHCSPRFMDRDGHSSPCEAEFQDGDIVFRGSEEKIARLSASIPLQIASADPNSAPHSSIDRNPSLCRSFFTLDVGQVANFRWCWGFSRPTNRVQEAQSRPTIEAWQGWAHHCVPETCPFVGPWHDAVIRSSLILHLLSQPETGAIARSIAMARDTRLDGDERCASIRDGAWAIQAMANLGYHSECKTWFRWLSDLLERDGAEGLQAKYRLDGARDSAGFQLSLYGDVLLAAMEYHRCFGNLPEDLWPKLSTMADLAGQAWRRPDLGYWSDPGKPKHFVVSKLFAWVALDRAIQLGAELGHHVPPRWARERGVLHQTICQQGFDPTLGSFVRSFGDPSLDSANLLMPILGFLPIDDSRIVGTLAATQAELSRGILLQRGSDSDAANGPCHLLSSLWLVQCLILSGQIDESSDRLAEICSYATDLGIFGEYVDPQTSETTGNFPSAPVHLALINTSLYLAAARGRRIPTGHLMGLKDVPCVSEGAERKRAS